MIEEREMKFWAIIHCLSIYYAEKGADVPKWAEKLEDELERKNLEHHFMYCDVFKTKYIFGPNESRSTYKDYYCDDCPLDNQKFGSDKNSMDGCDRSKHPLRKYYNNQSARNAKAVLKAVRDIPVPKTWHMKEGALLRILKDKIKKWWKDI